MPPVWNGHESSRIIPLHSLQRTYSFIGADKRICWLIKLFPLNENDRDRTANCSNGCQPQSSIHDANAIRKTNGRIHIFAVVFIEITFSVDDPSLIFFNDNFLRVHNLSLFSIFVFYFNLLTRNNTDYVQLFIGSNGFSLQ